MKWHELKILPEYFSEVKKGTKRFELRKNDRDFKVGDSVMLNEWTGGKYTGRCSFHIISYVLKDCPEYGLKDGYCIFGW